jgi:hypothetical protein
MQKKTPPFLGKFSKRTDGYVTVSSVDNLVIVDNFNKYSVSFGPSSSSAYEQIEPKLEGPLILIYLHNISKFLPCEYKKNSN